MTFQEARPVVGSRASATRRRRSTSLGELLRRLGRGQYLAINRRTRLLAPSPLSKRAGVDGGEPDLLDQVADASLGIGVVSGDEEDEPILEGRIRASVVREP